MKKYLLLFAALSLASAATARNPRKTSRAARLQAAEAAADSLRAVTTRQAAVIDSLQCIAVCPEEEECAPAEEPQQPTVHVLVHVPKEQRVQRFQRPGQHRGNRG